MRWDAAPLTYSTTDVAIAQVMSPISATTPSRMRGRLRRIVDCGRDVASWLPLSSSSLPAHNALMNPGSTIPGHATRATGPTSAGDVGACAKLLTARYSGAVTAVVTMASAPNIANA